MAVFAVKDGKFAKNSSDELMTPTVAPDFIINPVVFPSCIAGIQNTVTVTVTRVGGHNLPIALSIALTGSGTIASGENSGTLYFTPPWFGNGTYTWTIEARDNDNPQRFKAITADINIAQS